MERPNFLKKPEISKKAVIASSIGTVGLAAMGFFGVHEAGNSVGSRQHINATLAECVKSLPETVGAEPTLVPTLSESCKKYEHRFKKHMGVIIEPEGNSEVTKVDRQKIMYELPAAQDFFEKQEDLNAIEAGDRDDVNLRGSIVAGIIVPAVGVGGFVLGRWAGRRGVNEHHEEPSVLQDEPV